MRALLPHRGLAHAIPPHQTLVVVIAAQLLRGDGSATGTEKAFPAVDYTERFWLDFRSLPTGSQLHGHSFRIRTPSTSVRAALSSQTFCVARRHPRRRYCSSCLFGRHAIWRKVSGRRIVGRADTVGERMAGIRFAHIPDRSGQFLVADRKLDRELHICGSDRGFAP